MSDIDPAAVMAAHAEHGRGYGLPQCVIGGGGHCEPYRLAEALTEALRRGDYTVLAESLELAERERDEAREALAEERAKVARIETLAGTHLASASALSGGDLRAALADRPGY